eukprot:jgi/Hompol1/4811/HPOL_003895-RA
MRASTAATESASASASARPSTSTSTSTSVPLPSRPLRVAVVGSGIAGLSAAWLLASEPKRFALTLIEAGATLGGHTNTATINSINSSHSSAPISTGVDTGFIVCNPVTYPNFLALMAELDVPLERSDMSFSVSRNAGEFEWSGDNLDTVFAQRSNLLPFSGMYRLLYDCIRFHNQAKDIATEADMAMFDENGSPISPSAASDFKGASSTIQLTVSGFKDHPLAKLTLGQFFKDNGYSTFFYENYVLPMTAAIWSSPADVTFDKFPLLTLVRFMRNHVMLQIGGRPKWLTVTGGSKTYVDKIKSLVKDIRLNTKIVSIQRNSDERVSGPITLTDSHGNTFEFDHVIFATHTDQALRILGPEATPAERTILGSIKYSANRAVLHRDASLMPKRRKAWASWNYLTTSKTEAKSNSMCLTYWMNRLQPFVDVETFGEVFVTMNPLVEPKEDTVLGSWNYEHPEYSPGTIQAQEKLNEIQGKYATTYCGAWTNYGFHEDGCTSGLLAAISLGATCPFPVSLNGGYPTARKPPNPPAYLAKLGVKRYVPPPPTYVAHTKDFKAKLARDRNALGVRLAVTFGAMAIVVALIAFTDVFEPLVRTLPTHVPKQH